MPRFAQDRQCVLRAGREFGKGGGEPPGRFDMGAKVKFRLCGSVGWSPEFSRTRARPGGRWPPRLDDRQLALFLDPDEAQAR